jgi:hypothetical protein
VRFAAAQIHQNGDREGVREISREAFLAFCEQVAQLDEEGLVNRFRLAPPGWARDDWELLVLVVRYHRGAEPKNAHRSFFRLPKKRQEVVRLLAGVLRLARALRRSGVRARPRLRADTTATGVRLRVAGVVDTQANAARLAGAKHLLDLELKRPLFIESIRHPGSSATRRSAIRRPGR